MRNRKNRRSNGGGRRAVYFEFLEARALLTVTFAPGTVAGTWGYGGMGADGSIQFDDANNVTGGSLTDATDSTSTPGGTYTIDGGGSVGLALADGHQLSGTMDSSGDLMAVTEGSSTNDTLSLLTKTGGTDFGISDLSGTWSISVNGSDSGNTGQGTIVFDGNGNVTGGSLVSTDGTSSYTGNYTVSSTGVVTLNLTLKEPDKAAVNRTFTGQLNGNGDTLAMDPGNLAQATMDDDGLLVVAVQHMGTYTNASLNSTWGLVSDDVQGSITFNGAGKITGGGGTSGDGAFTLGGSYSVASNGTFTVNILVIQGSGNKTIVEKGTLNSGDTFGAMEEGPQVKTTTNDGSGDGLMFIVNSNNHVPTLTSVSPLFLAATGIPYSFSFDNLLASTNAADADGDAISLVITSLSSGTLAVNGDTVTAGDLPVTISSGDNLTWTSAAGGNGTVTAFSVKATDGTATSATAVAVGIDTVITPGYGDGDLSGPWGLNGIGFAGTVEFDGAGTISGGLLVDSNGGTDTPSGPYAVADSGELVLASGNTTSAGAINPMMDVAAFSESGDSNFNVLVNSSDGNFTDSDVTGTWTFGYEGAEGDTNGVGTITLDSEGNVSGGSISKSTGTSPIIGGNYSIDSDGVLSINVSTRDSNGVVSSNSYQGHVNNSRDFAALDPTDLQTATADNATTLLVMVRSSGTYSNADLNGTWMLDESGGFNAVSFDGKGKVSANGAVIGAYAVTAAGKVTLTTGGTMYTGAINRGKNALVLNASGANVENGLLLMIDTADHAPSANATGTIAKTGFVSSQLTLSYNDVLTAMGASDLDGDALTVDFTAASQAFGCLTIMHNGQQAAVGNGTTMVSGDTLIFNPAKVGKAALFSAKVSDGTLSSGTSAVAMNVLLLPAVQAVTTVATAEESLAGNAAGNGVITLTRSGGNMSGSLAVTVGVSGGASDGTNYTLEDAQGNTIKDGSTVTFLAGQSTEKLNVMPQNDNAVDLPLSVIVTVEGDANQVSPLYTVTAGKASAAVTVLDAAPTVTVAAGTPVIKEGGSETFTFTRTAAKGGTLTGLTTVVPFDFSASSFSLDNISAPQPESVTFASGQTSVKYTVTTSNDGVANGTEALILTIDTNGATFVAGGTGIAVAAVTDQSSTISLAATKPKASELNPATSGQGLFTFTRTGGDLSGALTVNVTWSGTATTDYASLPTTVMFTPGKATATVAITPLDDQLNNGTQTVTATISGGEAYHVTSVAAQQSATVTITDVRIPPASLTGVSIAATITGGTGNFAKSGAYTLVFSPTTDGYVMVGTGAVPTTAGTFTYTVTGSTTAALTLTPASGPASQILMVFSAPTTATFTFTTTGVEGQQTGKMTGTPAPAVGLAAASLSGRTLTAKVSSASGVFAGQKGFELIPSQNSDNYVGQNIPSPGVSTGTYAYSVFSANLGIMTFTDSVTGGATMYLLFTSKTALNYVSVKTDGDAEEGSMTLNAVAAHTFAPTTITGDVTGLIVSGGISPYPKSGLADTVYTDTTYDVKDVVNGVPGATIDTGNYTYEQYTPTIGIAIKDDTNFGNEIMILTFTSANVGTYLTLNVDNVSDQTGKFGIL